MSDFAEGVCVSITVREAIAVIRKLLYNCAIDVNYAGFRSIELDFGANFAYQNILEAIYSGEAFEFLSYLSFACSIR